MQPIIDSINRIIYKIHKKKNPLLAEIIINWQKIVGAKYMNNSFPLKINTVREKGKKLNILMVEVNNSSTSVEITFQQDITDRAYIKDVLRLIARELSFQIRLDGTYIKTITLKITFKDMKKITRSKTGDATSKTDVIYNTAAALLDKVERRPIRLVGISLSGFTDAEERQLTLFDDSAEAEKSGKLDKVTINLQRKYGIDIVKSGSEMIAEKRFNTD